METAISAALSTLAPILVEQLSSALTSNNVRFPSASGQVTDSHASGTSVNGAPNTLDVHDILSNPALPIRPSFYDKPRDLGPCMTLPFQFKLHDWKGDVHLINIDLAAEPNLAKLTAPYRYAELVTLEVVFLPRQGASKYPGTAEVRFLPSDVTPVQNDMVNHPGAVSVSIGGPLSFVSNCAVPCALNRFSPVIKSPFLPTDRIRVAVNHWLNTDATSAKNTHVLITTILRGEIRLAYPAFN